MRRRARPGGGRQVEITIRGIGARGDGFASVDGELVFVPFTVAGDRVTARITGQRAGGAKAEVVELLSEGPGRAEPPCPHFGPCGGCALQHLADAHYADWKAALLAQALAHRGFADVEIRPMVRVPPGTRRRATLAAVKRDGKVRLGFHGRESHTVVDVSTCLLLTPALAGLLPPMRALLSEVLADGETAAAVVTETAEGPDVFIASPLVPGHAAREKLAAFAAAADVARLSWA
jgi:23S rRNA (uracil1939-C5)-methyltransferase